MQTRGYVLRFDPRLRRADEAAIRRLVNEETIGAPVRSLESHRSRRARPAGGDDPKPPGGSMALATA